MFPIQGQLNIIKKKFCNFVLYAENEDIWINIMLPKLKLFYVDCLLPEIVDPVHTNGRLIREPAYRLEANKKVRSKNSASSELP